MPINPMNHKIVQLIAGLMILLACINCGGIESEQAETPFYLATISSLEPLADSIADLYNDSFPKFQAVQVVVLDEDNLWYALGQHQVQAVMDWQVRPSRSVFIGWTAIVFVNHPENPVQNLSETQVVDIFGGRIHRWEDLGNASGEIHVVSYGRDLELYSIFQKTVLGWNQLTNNALSVATPYAMRETVSRDVSSIGYLLCFDRSPMVQTITVDQIQPNYVEIKNGSYSFRVQLFLNFLETSAESVNPLAGWLQSGGGEKAISDKCP
jgi:hypothetical protein